MLKQIVLLVSLFFLSLKSSVDLIVFSYDRPLQLYAFIESCQKNIKKLNNKYVVCRYSSLNYYEAYKEISQKFFDYNFIFEQQEKKSFQDIILDLFSNISSEYIMFAVDDIVVVDELDCSFCSNILQETGAYGFFLRLGKNITYCYTCNKNNPVPPLEYVRNSAYIFNFNDGIYDWNYPHTLDMTIYKKSDILSFFYGNYDWKNPNTLEAKWAKTKPAKQVGLCFENSKIVNIPLGVVQDAGWTSRNMHFKSKEELLRLFLQGFKINIDTLSGYVGNALHCEVVPDFIKR